MRHRVPALRPWATAAAVGLVLTACGSGGETTADLDAVSARIDRIEEQVTAWAGAADLASARAAAEAAANLVTGPEGPGYGDRDGDGTVGGGVDAGLLPGREGTPEGIALGATSDDCALTDVLGGPWDDPGGRWRIFEEALADWRPDDNTFPGLPSHAQRVIGWAELTLATDDLDTAHEYAGHAQLHVDAMRRSVAEC